MKKQLFGFVHHRRSRQAEAVPESGRAGRGQALQFAVRSPERDGTASARAKPPTTASKGSRKGSRGAGKDCVQGVRLCTLSSGCFLKRGGASRKGSGFAVCGPLAGTGRHGVGPGETTYDCVQGSDCVQGVRLCTLSSGCFLKRGGATREPDSAEDSKVQSLTLSGDPPTSAASSGQVTALLAVAIMLGRHMHHVSSSSLGNGGC